jgi:hypothetical protein
MSVKPCDNYNMIMVNYADLWLMHSHVTCLLDSAKLELRELKACSTLLEIKNLKHKFDYSSRYTVLSPPYVVCDSLKGKLFHAIKENIELKQEVAYLTACLEKTVLSEKIIEQDLS